MRESKAERAGKAFEKRLREGDSGFVDGVQQLRNVAESIRLLESQQDCPERERVRVELQAVLDEYLPQLAAEKAKIQAESERLSIPDEFDDDPLEWCLLACEILEADPETVEAADLYRKLKARYWKKRQDACQGDCTLSHAPSSTLSR